MDEKRMLIEFLSGLEEETTREYEIKITDNAIKKEFLAQFTEREIEDYLKEIIGDKELEKQIRYNAFYMLNIICRRKKKRDLLKEIFDRHGADFRNQISYSHIYNLYLLETDFEDNYEDAIKAAMDVMKKRPDNAGYVHAFASTVAHALERVNEQVRQEVMEHWYEEAVAAIEEAIKLDRFYAKYYYTRARLEMAGGNYDAAEKSVSTAIAREDPNQENYLLRTSDYHHFRTKILVTKQRYQYDKIIEDVKTEMRQEQELYMQKLKTQQQEYSQEREQEQGKIKKEVDEEIKRVNRALINNVEMVGFFAGIVSLTIGSINIAQHNDFVTSAGLIVILLGGLLFVYSGFGFIFSNYAEDSTDIPEQKTFLQRISRYSKYGRYGICAIAGLIIVIGGFLIGKLL